MISSNRQHVAFLGFVTPDFQRAHARFVAQDIAQFEFTAAPAVAHQFRHGVRKTARTDVVDKQNWVSITKLRADASARKVIEAESLDLRYYSVIYNLIDEVKAAMSGMLSPELKQQIIGLAEVRDVFKSPKFGAIAGCMVTEGVVKRHNPIRVLRDNVVIYEGELESLRRFKDDVNEVRNGMECGIGVKNYNDVRTGDVIEVFEIIEIQRTIA